MPKLYSAAICIVGPRHPMFCKHTSPKVISSVASKLTSCIRARGNLCQKCLRQTWYQTFLHFSCVTVRVTVNTASFKQGWTSCYIVSTNHNKIMLNQFNCITLLQQKLHMVTGLKRQLSNCTIKSKYTRCNRQLIMTKLIIIVLLTVYFVVVSW